jgi:Ferroportin1 (FPN1)
MELFHLFLGSSTDATGLRAALNARMRRIDLICKLGGPLTIALIQGASTKAAVLITLGFNALSVVIEYFAIASVRGIPDIEKVKAKLIILLGLQDGPSSPNFTTRVSSQHVTTSPSLTKWACGRSGIHTLQNATVSPVRDPSTPQKFRVLFQASSLYPLVRPLHALLYCT